MALSEALQQKVNNVVNAIKTLISNHNTSNTAHTDIRNAIETKANKSHPHGNLTAGGTLTSSTSAVSKVVVTDSSNNLKVVSRIPFENLDLTIGDLEEIGLPTCVILARKEDVANKTGTISSLSTEDQYPNALATYNAINTKAPKKHDNADGDIYGKATKTLYGHTKLSSAVDSTDETIAATPKAVKTAYDLANSKPNLGTTSTTAAKGDHTHNYAPTSHTSSDGATYGKATTSVYGHTKLSSLTNSESEEVAATPKGVKAAYDLAKGKFGTAGTGLVSSGTTISANIGGNTDTSNGKLVSCADSRLSDARIPLSHADERDIYGKATTSLYGHTKLSSDINSSSEVLAATPKAVTTAYNLANTAKSVADSKPDLGTTATTAAKGNHNHDSAYAPLAATNQAIQNANNQIATNSTLLSNHADTAASTQLSGHVQLSSSVTSDSETTAATSKAVKTAYEKDTYYSILTTNAPGYVSQDKVFQMRRGNTVYSSVLGGNGVPLTSGTVLFVINGEVYGKKIGLDSNSGEYLAKLTLNLETSGDYMMYIYYVGNATLSNGKPTISAPTLGLDVIWIKYTA